MAIQPNKPSSRVFLIVGVALAALAFAGVLFALNQQKGGGNTASVVVAKKDIAAGTPVTADLVTVANVPTDATPTDAFQTTTQVVGKTTAASVKANTVLVPALFAQLGAPAASGGTTTASAPTATSVEFTLRKGDVALAIPVAGEKPANGQGTGIGGDLFSAGYYVLPGDHIDMLVDAGNGTIRYGFQDVPVIRVGSVGAAGTPSVFIVEIPRSQAELLTALVTEHGQPQTATNPPTSSAFIVKYVLRPQSEWGKLSADGATYSPNYLPSTGPALPVPADPGVSPQSLDSIFSK